MSMMTKNQSGIASGIRLLIAIPLSFILTSGSISASRGYDPMPPQFAPPPPLAALHNPPPAPAPEEHSESRADQEDQRMYQSRYIVQGSDTIYTFLRESAKFPGGSDALNAFRERNLRYPEEAKKAGMEGTVSVRFLVDRNGNHSDYNISSGISPSLDAEALRVVKLMPGWVPGVENGKPVKVLSGTTFTFDITPDDPPSEIFVVVEEMPVFPGGDSALIKYIVSNINYPAEAKEKHIQGRVILRFCITSLGGVEQVTVLRGVEPSLDFEAVRVIKSLPKWQPGKQSGKPVNVWYSVPVTFALAGPDPEENAPPPPPPPPPPMAPSVPTGYDEPPTFKGGEAELVRFIESEKKYPVEAMEKGLKGVVKIRFVVNEEGKVTNAMVFRGVSPDLDAEALRVINLLPQWKPGKYKGKPVKVTYIFPVSFKP